MPSTDDQLAQLRPNEAEQALLGAIFINNGAYHRVCAMLEPGDFSYAVHARIFSAIARLIDQGKTANPVTLGSFAESDKAILDLGGKVYLARLAGAAVTTINAPEYAVAIRDCARRRALIEACDHTIADAATVDPERSADAVLDEHERLIASIANGREFAGPVTLAEAATTAIAETEKAYQRGGGLAGVTTGLIDVDHALGGLLPGDLDVLASRPSMGKTALALGIAISAANSGVPSAFFELEQTAAQLAQRELAHRTGVPTPRQRRGNLDPYQWDALVRGAQSLRNVSVHIDDSSGLTVRQIAQRAKRLKRRHGIGLVIIDHLQLVSPAQKRDNQTQEITDITKELKGLAKHLELPVLLLSQLSRAVELRDNKRPMLADLRQSGSIEQDADRVMFLYRENYYRERSKPEEKEGEDPGKFAERINRWEDACSRGKHMAELIIAKDRHGEVGMVRLFWDPERVCFGNSVKGENS